MNSFTYQNKRKKDYFEGWYTRLVDTKNNINLAVIFALTKNELDPHAFIQVYDGVGLTNKYFRFDIRDFSFNGKVIIGDNTLSPSNLKLNVDNYKFDVIFDKIIPIKKYLGFDSAMSFLKMFPLVCFQEVNIIDGLFEGFIQINDIEVESKGEVYMEKTYGYKFPKKWIWIQGNHFENDLKLSFSVGYIPLLGKYRKGFFAILHNNNKEYRFGSFNFSRIKINKKTDEKVEIIIRKRKYRLVIEATTKNPIILVGPIDGGEMVLEVFESINSYLDVKLYKKSKLVCSGIDKLSGFEYMY